MNDSNKRSEHTARGISYKAVTKGYAVRHEGKTVGHIRLTLGGGYRYFPLGVKKTSAATFPTLQACKQSLEAA